MAALSASVSEALADYLRLVKLAGTLAFWRFMEAASPAVDAITGISLTAGAGATFGGRQDTEGYVTFSGTSTGWLDGGQAFKSSPPPLSWAVWCWIDPTATTSTQYLMATLNGNGTGQGLYLYLNAGRTPVWGGKTVGGTFPFAQGTALSTGALHLLVGTVAADNTYTLYVDGVQVAQVAANAANGPGVASWGLQLGRQFNGPAGSTFKGRLWRPEILPGVVLSAAQVADRWNLGRLAGTPTTEPKNTVTAFVARSADVSETIPPATDAPARKIVAMRGVLDEAFSDDEWVNGFVNPYCQDLTGLTFFAPGTVAPALIPTVVASFGFHADVWARLSGQPPANGFLSILAGTDAAGRVPVVPGDVAYFRAAVRAPTKAGAVYTLNPIYFDAAGVQLASPTQYLSREAQTSAVWQMLEGFDTVPAGAAFVGLGVSILNGSNLPSAVFDLGFVQITPDVDRIPPLVGGEEPGARWRGPRWASASSIPKGVRVNMMRDPTNEYAPAPWAVGGTIGQPAAVTSFDATWFEQGTRSQRVAFALANAGHFKQAQSPSVFVTPGQDVLVRARLNVRDAPNDTSAYLSVAFFDSNGTFIAQDVHRLARGDAEVAYAVAVPKNAYVAQLLVGGSGVVGNFDISWDGQMLVEDGGGDLMRGLLGGFNDQVFNTSPVGIVDSLAYDADLGVNACRPPMGAVIYNTPAIWPDPAGPMDLDLLAPYLDPIAASGQKQILLSGYLPWMLDAAQAVLQPAHYADFGTLAGAICARWPHIVAWEPGNEVNSANFWRGLPLVQTFVDALTAARPAFKALAPNVPLIAPTSNAPITGSGNLSLPDYMAQFYAAGGGPLCDGLSVHPYPSPGASSGSKTDTTKSFWMGLEECMYQLRLAAAAHGDAAKPIWITEFGLPTTPPAGAPPYLLEPVTEDQQAIGVRMLWEWARRQRDVVAAIIHVNVQASSGWDFGIMAPGVVVPESARRKKPAYAALKAVLGKARVPFFGGDVGAAFVGAPGFTPSVTSIASPAPTTSMQASTSRGVTDSIPTTDSVTRQAVVTRSLVDTIPTTQTVTRQVIAARAVADAAPASDTVTQHTATSRAVADDVDGADSPVANLHATRAVADDVDGSDAVTRRLVASRTVFNSAPASDVTKVRLVAARGVTEVLPAAADSPAVFSRTTRAVVDFAPAADSTARALVAVRAVSDGGVAGDSTSTMHAAFVSIVETVPPATDVVLTGGAVSTHVVETIPPAWDRVSSFFVGGKGESGKVQKGLHGSSGRVQRASSGTVAP